MSKTDSTTSYTKEDVMPCFTSLPNGTRQGEIIDREIAKCLKIRQAQLRDEKNAPPAQPAEQMLPTKKHYWRNIDHINSDDSFWKVCCDWVGILILCFVGVILYDVFLGLVVRFFTMTPSLFL